LNVKRKKQMMKKYGYIIFMYICLFILCSIVGKKKKNKNYKLPPNTQLYVFDNGFGGLWHSCDKTDSKNIIIFFNGFQESILNEYSNIKQLESIFEEYHILYLENPPFPLSETATPSRCLKHLFMDILLVYECVLRYKKWDKIGFIGYDFGGIIQSFVYSEAMKQHMKLPNWILHCNAPKDLSSHIYYKIPWYLQMFAPKYSLDVAEHYKNIQSPLYIIHTKKNKRISLMDAIQLYEKLKTKSIFVLIYGIHEKFLCSQENIDILTTQLKLDNII
jgi:hypothetical protein